MELNYIALSIPIFFLLIGIELLYGLIKKQKLYRLSDAISNIGCGVGQQLIGLLIKSGTFFLYYLLYQHFRIYDISNAWYWWVILFVGVDFCYYWFHRISHEVNFIWATHIVHHQSEDYNLSVALRQSWFQGLFSALFYLPLALVGFNPLMTLTVVAFNTLYQFWIHTEAIGKLGWFEYIFNTPSHHRVHHGSNRKYLDKNHAGTLIIWDRMFGTFKEEDTTPIYGITKPLKSWNPLWANFHYWVELYQIARKAENIKSALQVFIKSPGWHAEQSSDSENASNWETNTIQKYDVIIPTRLSIYVLIQFGFLILLATYLLFQSAQLENLAIIASVGLAVVHLTLLGLMLEMKKFSIQFEWLRIISLASYVLFFEGTQVITIAILVFIFISAIHYYFVSLFKPISIDYIKL